MHPCKVLNTIHTYGINKYTVVKRDLLNCNACLCLNKLYLQSRLIPNYACVNIPNKSAATKCRNALHDHSHVVFLIVMETFCFFFLLLCH